MLLLSLLEQFSPDQSSQNSIALEIPAKSIVLGNEVLLVQTAISLIAESVSVLEHV
jgi:hypothetical protein